MPEFKLALLCQGLDQNTQTGNYSLYEVFQSVEAKQNPQGINFILVAFWHGEVGEKFKQSFTVLDSKGQILADSPSTVITIAYPQHNTINPFHGVIPPIPGKYSININVEGISVGAAFITVT